MSTIRVDDVGPSAGGTTKSLVRGTASAWVNFDGTGTIAARDSLNVSSLTDNGTGDYTVNFTSAFANANFSNTTNAGDAAKNVRLNGAETYTSSSVRFPVRNIANSLKDPEIQNCHVQGDLA